MEIIWFETENSSMFVSMANYGITFSAEVIKSMGNPEYVKMGYSIEKRKIIVKICDVDDPMKLEFKGRNKRNYVRIASKFFIKFIKKITGDENIVDDKSSKYKAEWNSTEKTLYISTEKEKTKKELQKI